MREPCISCTAGVGWLRHASCLHLCTCSIIWNGTGIQCGCEHSPLHTVVIKDFFNIFQLKKQFVGVFLFIFSQQYTPSSSSLCFDREGELLHSPNSVGFYRTSSKYYKSEKLGGRYSSGRGSCSKFVGSNCRTL